MTSRLLALAVLLVAGCGARYTEPPLASDHPANPAAAPSPVSPRSPTLDLAAAEPITPVAVRVPVAPAGHEHGQPASAPAAPQAATLYICPMHPEVTADRPDQRCTKCGMKLVPKKEGGA